MHPDPVTGMSLFRVQYHPNFPTKNWHAGHANSNASGSCEGYVTFSCAVKSTFLHLRASKIRILCRVCRFFGCNTIFFFFLLLKYIRFEQIRILWAACRFFMCKNQVFRQTIKPKFESCHRRIAVLRIPHACASATPHRFSTAFRIGFSRKRTQDTSLQLKLPCFQLRGFSTEHDFTTPQPFSHRLRRNHKKINRFFI